MKRYPLVFALAASSFSMPAHAASEVILYGTIDVGYQYLHVKGQGTSSGLLSGGQGASRFGLRGSESLGEGLQANFQLEGGYNATNGMSTSGVRSVFGRTTWLGLGGGFGELRMGRQTLAATSLTEIYSPFGSSFKLAGAGSAINSNTTPRADNTVKYISPDLGGFQMLASYSFNAHLAQNKDWIFREDDHDSKDRVISTGASYGGPNWKLAAYYQQAMLDGGTSTNLRHHDVSPREYGLGGRVSFGPATLHAGWARHQDAYINGVHPNNAGQAAVFPGGVVNGYTLGMSYEIGAGKLLAQFQYNDPDTNVRRNGVKAHDQKVYSVGYIHTLSKRTNFYTYLSYLDGAWFDNPHFNNRPFNNGQPAVKARDWNATQFMVGIKHQF